MGDFRYSQFCPLARASEILGERWTLPVIRELFVAPQRFTDLRRRLPGLSSSVLAARLERLARAGIVAQRDLPPPAAATVYELTDAGRALQPVLKEMIRWGVRFLGAPAQGDHFEPEWPMIGLQALARSGPTPELRAEVHLLRDDGPPVVFHVAGGPGGTRIEPGPAPGPVDIRLSGPPIVMLGLVSGALPSSGARAHPKLVVDGDAAALATLPRLFELAGPPGPDAPANPTDTKE